MCERTVDSSLKALPADLAVQVTHSGLFVHLDVNALFVVAKETVEDGCQLLLLLGALGLLRGLALSL